MKRIRTFGKWTAVVAGWALGALLVCAAIWALKEIPRWQVNEVARIALGRDEVRAFELDMRSRLGPPQNYNVAQR
jgi:hypothetical protein